MTNKHNARNERIQHRYFEFLKHATPGATRRLSGPSSGRPARRPDWGAMGRTHSATW